MKALLRNSNRTQVLLTEAMLKKIPGLYAQEAKGQDAIAHLKLFGGSWSWYITEINPETLEAFGKVYSSMCPDGELGYMDLKEIAAIRLPPFNTGVERDLYFKPCPLKDCKNPCT